MQKRFEFHPKHNVNSEDSFKQHSTRERSIAFDENEFPFYQEDRDESFFAKLGDWIYWHSTTVTAFLLGIIEFLAFPLVSGLSAALLIFTASLAAGIFFSNQRAIASWASKAFSFISEHPYIFALSLIASVLAMVFPPAAFLPTGAASFGTAALIRLGLLANLTVFAAFEAFELFYKVIEATSAYLFPPPSPRFSQNDDDRYFTTKSNYSSVHSHSEQDLDQFHTRQENASSENTTYYSDYEGSDPFRARQEGPRLENTYHSEQKGSTNFTVRQGRGSSENRTYYSSGQDHFFPSQSSLRQRHEVQDEMHDDSCPSPTDSL